MIRTQLVLLLLSLTVVHAPAHADDLTLHVGTLIAVPGEAPLKDRTVLIEGNRITAILDGFRDPAAGSRLLDLRDAFVLPGLMDVHVHLLFDLDAGARARRLSDTPTLTAMRGVANARRTLDAGFTTVRDLGGAPESIFAIRDAIAAGLIPGPRVIAAGSALAATGGHGDVDGVRADLMALWTPDSICDGAVDCRRATREAIKYGADWIKITATGGVLSDTGTGLGVQMTDDELAEIVRTAHGLGVKVAAHAHGTDGIDAALAAGVDSIDHGTFLDEGSVDLFLEQDAWLVPTLMPGHYVPLAMADNPFYTDAIKAKANTAAEASKRNFALAARSGVKIAFGTDTGVTPHGDNAKEFALMVAAGMTPAEALRSATVMSARMLGMEDRLGTIEAGKLADLVVVGEDPLTDVTALERIAAVIRDGKVVLRAAP
ncbi:MAG TPA: amidohydrolase family protein [Pseudomonadales bacterium]|nr:amidohydrolase family protein [Pseudomonadales bacterium]